MPDDRLPTTESADDILKRVSSTAEVITSSDSQTLIDFHKFLVEGGFFTQEEVEPLEVYQRELANKNPDVRFILTALRDPKKPEELVSAAYGSVQNGVLAIRFTLTEGSYRAVGLRSTGISEEADRLLVDEAKRFCDEKKVKLYAYVCEAVESSEGYINQLGPKRLYFPGTMNEIHYELPPLAWNSDGTPAMDGIPEHLQVSVEGYPEQVPVSVLEKIVRDWWKEWYIRPREQFESDQAWELHKQTVWGILENKILAPMRSVSELTLISKKERKASEKSTQQ